MFGIKILPMHFGWGLFCCCNFIFFYIDDKEKTNLTVRSSHSNLLFLKIYKYYTFKKSKWDPTGTSSNIYFIYKKLLQTFRKSICLVKEFFLVNPFIGVFWGLLPRKTPLICGNFHYTVNLLLLLSCLLLHFTTKPLWNCISLSQMCCTGCCSLSLSLSVWPNMYRILICRFHMIIPAGAVWKLSLDLRGYILKPAEVVYIIFCLQV